MNPMQENRLLMTRRYFFGLNAAGLGTAALTALLGKDILLAQETAGIVPSVRGGLPGLPHFLPKAKRVIWLFQSGGPSQLELFDYKPSLQKFRVSDLPAINEIYNHYVLHSTCTYQEEPSSIAERQACEQALSSM